MTRFARAPTRDWHLADRVEGDRRRYLLGAGTFEDLVSDICHSYSQFTVTREPKDGDPSYCRVVVTLHCAPALVDKFHNSVFGYRAQYYVSPDLGEKANAHFVRQISMALPSLEHRRVDKDLVQRSLRHAQAKGWIKEGKWWRYASWATCDLLVPRWWAHRRSLCRSHRVLVRWAAQAPGSECRI